MTSTTCLLIFRNAGGTGSSSYASEARIRHSPFPQLSRLRKSNSRAVNEKKNQSARCSGHKITAEENRIYQASAGQLDIILIRKDTFSVPWGYVLRTFMGVPRDREWGVYQTRKETAIEWLGVFWKWNEVEIEFS
ncbi:hypothetical protein CDAR_54051 [Caerostris darwini]|uniref:Uncharacterized protein n=1 Tax=Caerostris darwini TaxID=1538125 RepID=A0AAV4WCW8_9ARAC|nr:hypothetical protein CDAR_54051 [Caerostris darwini]